MKQVYKQPTSQEVIRQADHLALYDRYGSMAYGLILQIIPEPDLAQAVLVDLFTSPQLKSYAETPSQVAGEIIRLARNKALIAKPIHTTPSLSIPVSTTNDNTAKLVFDLSFCQGYTPEAIAEKLQLSRTNVLKSIYTYFKQLRSS
ncbi:RNA polymerase sigma factor [Spirosoma flavum]